jgi:nucleotide-binding universal stress UspA family protein
MFKKILVPLDGSDLAGKILPAVAELAKQFKARVTLLTVGSSDTSGGKGAGPQPELPLANYLEENAGKLRAQGLEVDWVYKLGQPAQEIGAYAAENGMDLIALATHGAGEVAWVLGSVAKKVMAHAPAPVLLWRVAELEPPKLKSEMFYSLQTP